MGDPYFSNVSLLAHFDGTNGSTTFIDSSPNNLVMFAPDSGTDSISTASPKFGTGCLAVSTGVQFGSLASNAYLGAGQFTVEAWVNFTSFTGSGVDTIISQWDVGGQYGWLFGWFAGSIGFSYSTGGYDGAGPSGAYTPSLNAWYHVATDRDATNTLRVYVNGAVLCSQVIVGAFYSSNQGGVIGNTTYGITHPNNGTFPGYIDEVRITVGVARYAGAFTPPTAPFSNSLPTPVIQFADRVSVATATTGTGTIALGAASAGFRSFAAAVTAGALTSGATVYYAIQDTANAWEVGTGVYTSGAETLSRTVSSSSLGGTALSLSGTALVYLTITALSFTALTTTQIAALLAAGTITIGSSTAASVSLVLDAATGNNRQVWWQSAGLNRWCLFADATAETGSNAGSNLELYAFNDAGTFLYTPVLLINRATGLITANNGIALSGTAIAPTPAINNSSSQIATTAFVLGQISPALPLINSTAAVGSGTTFAAADHVHPVDTSRQASLGFTPVQQGGGTGQTTDKVYLGWSTAGTGAKVTVDATDVGFIASTIYPQSFVQTGGAYTFANVNVTAASVGSLQATPGNTVDTGYFGFFNAGGTRMGYMGYGATNLTLQAESTTTGWSTPLQMSVGESVNVGTTATIGTQLYANGILYSNAAANNFFLGIDSYGNRSMNYETYWLHQWVAGNGNYAFFVTSPAVQALYFSEAIGGHFVVYGTMSASNISDERTKRNVRPYTRGLADIIQLEPVSFEYNGLGGTTKDDKVWHGVTAQQAQPFVPECVRFTDDPISHGHKPEDIKRTRLPGQLSFDEKPLIFAALNAFKEIDARLRSIEQTLGI